MAILHRFYCILVLVIYREKCNEVTDQHLNPIKVLHATEDVMSENAIMVADGGDFVGTAAYILRYQCYIYWAE